VSATELSNVTAPALELDGGFVTFRPVIYGQQEGKCSVPGGAS